MEIKRITSQTIFTVVIQFFRNWYKIWFLPMKLLGIIFSVGNFLNC
jgi:hypothetical protein